MSEVRWTENGDIRMVVLDTTPTVIGRASDCGVVLKDFSVSRRHAKFEQRGDVWWVFDTGSTNGVKVNGRYVSESPLIDGDQVQVGNYTLAYSKSKEPEAASVGSSTFLRPLDQFREDFNLERSEAAKPQTSAAASARERVLEGLAQVAHTLLEVEELEPVLEKVMEAIFEQLPAERAYVLLFTPTASPSCAWPARAAAPRSPRRRSRRRSSTW